MTVFVTADPGLPVPPVHYGGIERVVAQLVDGLTDRGHAVTLFAHRDSHVAGALEPWAEAKAGRVGSGWMRTRQLATAWRHRRPDVIQSFSRLAYLAPLLLTSTPKVMSYQRAITAGRVRWSHRLARGTLTFTGCSRRLVAPVAHVGRWRVIYNAVPVDRYPFSPDVPADAPLVFLGRIEEIKGPHLAIDVARRAERRLVLAGNVPEEHQRFFEARVRPHIDGDRVKYIGPVDDRVKASLLGSAAALLMPVLWEEPFGIVMAEALACGTPVIGLARGAVPEVVRPGLTGEAAGTSEAMADAVRRVASFDRAACRRDAETRFSSTALVTAYEALYDEIVAGRATGVARERTTTQETHG